MMDVRARADEIAARISTDPQFLQRLVLNPRQTLEEFRLSPDAANDLILGEGREPDPSAQYVVDAVRDDSALAENFSVLLVAFMLMVQLRRGQLNPPTPTGFEG
jgi:hypothetical protein